MQRRPATEQLCEGMAASTKQMMASALMAISTGSIWKRVAWNSRLCITPVRRLPGTRRLQRRMLEAMRRHCCHRAVASQDAHAGQASHPRRDRGDVECAEAGRGGAACAQAAACLLHHPSALTSKPTAAAAEGTAVQHHLMKLSKERNTGAAIQQAGRIPADGALFDPYILAILCKKNGQLLKLI